MSPEIRGEFAPDSSAVKPTDTKSRYPLWRIRYELLGPSGKKL